MSVSGPWTRLYDQGGLFIFFPNRSVAGQPFWLKAGIEFYHERLHISVVASREWSDWSLTETDAPDVTIEVEREVADKEKGTGSSLFLYIVKDGIRSEVPIREITWAFEQEGEMSVGVYAARPTSESPNDDKKLEVLLELSWE